MRFTRGLLYSLVLIATTGCVSNLESPRRSGAPFAAAEKAYSKKLNLSRGGDTSAIKWIFRFTTRPEYVGVMAEVHSTSLLQLLNEIGDMSFANLLTRENFATRKAVISALDYAGWQPATYPYTAAAGR